MGYNDKHLKCGTCGGDFVFTAGEQEFFASQGFKNEPKHCQGCRVKRRKYGTRHHGRGQQRRESR